MNVDPSDVGARAWRAQLDRCAAFDTRNGEGAALPVALTALHALGADPPRLQARFDATAPRLAKAPAAAPWPAGDAWAGRLGDPAAFAAYRDLFAQWLAHEDAGEVLRSVLPRLMDGCGALGFDALLRTAWAVRAAHRGELADALAAWAAHWLDLGPLPDEAPGVADPAALLPTLPLPAPSRVLLAQRLRVATRPAAFRAAVARLAVDAGTLPALAGGAAQLFAASGHPLMRQLLCSADALQQLLPWLDDPAPALRAYALAWCAAWAASGAQAQGAAPAPRPWPALVRAAVSSDDLRLPVLVHACRALERAHGGAVWRRAATRAVDRR